MITEYIRAAMAFADYEYVDEDGEPPFIFGTISMIPGIWAKADTFPDCQVELQSVLEGWILLGLRMGDVFPVIGGVDLNVEIQRPILEAA
jgi:hypothetical protein